MTFIRKHWLGQYSLSISFWLVLVLLGFVYHFFASFILQQISLAYSKQLTSLIVYQFSGGILLLPWQVIGVLRSAEYHFKTHGRPIILHSVQAVVLVGSTVILSHFVGQIQTLTIEKDISDHQAKVTPTQYSIQWRQDKKQILLSGPLDFGVTNAVRQLLEIHPNAEQVVLESEGGQIYEGRGLAVLFQQYEIDTYSFSYCLSSCTTAFIGGTKRYLGKDAELGFHQYAYKPEKLKTFQTFYNLEDEQNKDLEIYRSKNVSEDFITQMFKKPNNEIWYPDRETLLETGVVTAIVRQ